MAEAGASSSGRGGRRIQVFCSGSRGDMQPFAAVALGLQRAGHELSVCSNATHVGFLQQLGLEAKPVYFDVQKFLDENEEFRENMAKGRMLGMMKASKSVMAEHLPQDMASCQQAIESWKPELIICHPLRSYEVVLFAERRGIPIIGAQLQLLLPSRCKPTVLREPAWCPHWLLGTAIFLVLFKMVQKQKDSIIRKLEPEALRFSPSSFREFMLNIFHPIAPSVVGVSPTLDSVAEDWPDELKRKLALTGFWVLDQGEQASRMEREDVHFGGEDGPSLKAFLSAGSPPVYLGWGSMVSVSGEHMTCLAVRSLMKVQRRGIIAAGWARLEAAQLENQPDSDAMRDYARERVLFVKSAPHEWLFPQCCAIVHHGGSGTLAASLRSGVPSIVTPFAFDQFDNARLLSKSGAGVATRQFSKLTVTELASVLQQCLSDQSLISTARSLGGRLSKEDGVGAVVGIVGEFLTNEFDSGRWKAAWDRRQRERKILLAQRLPGWMWWLGRCCCSASPNDYTVAGDGS